MSIKKRPETKKQDKKQKKEVDMKRLLNVGKEIKLSFGTYTVKELDVFTLIGAASDGLDKFLSLQSGAKNDLEFISHMAKDNEFKSQVAKIFALFCGSETKEELAQFEKITAGDFAKLLLTIKEVVDFDEIKEAFFALGLQKYLPQSGTSPISTETSE